MMDEASIQNIEEKVYHLLERKRLDQAEGLINTGLRSQPDNLKLLYYLACIQLEREDFKEAEVTLSGILEKDPLDAASQYLLVMVYTHQDQYEKAEALIIELIRDYPESSDFYAAYAKIMLSTLHLDKAMRLAREAIRYEPDNVTAQSISVICEVIRNKRAESQQRLFELVRNHPEAYETATMMILVLNDQRRYKEALRVAREVLKSDPSNDHILEIIKELRVATHFSMMPLWPMLRFGWHASAVLWGVMLFTSYIASNYLSEKLSAIIVFGWLGYVIYSWVYPPILRKILNR